MSKSFETLKKEFPVFVIKNKKNIPKSLVLENGEEITIGENATVNVDSSDLIQMPDMTTFKVVSPTYADLVAHNVISAPTPAPEPAKPPKSEGDKEAKTN